MLEKDYRNDICEPFTDKALQEVMERTRSRAGQPMDIAAHKAEADNRPICPDCKTVMVKTHIELEDGSGWFSGWGCECEYEPD